MSDRIRFTAAQQIFESFPMAVASVEARPGEESPLDFLRRLIARPHRFDAITYAAALLPRREAVWWGCQCVRALGDGKADEALAAAEAWVRDPDDASRYAALALWESGDHRSPTPWLAMAAADSGGNVAPEGAPPHWSEPYMTAVAVKAAIILAIAEKPAREQSAWTAACAEAAIRFAEGGDAKVHPPAQPARKAAA